MSLKKVLGKTLLNSWVISVVLGTIVFILIPFHPDPYKVESTLEHMFAPRQAIQFADLDGDGMQEVIKSEYLPEKEKALHVVSRLAGNTNDQYNIEGVESLVSYKPHIGDYNSDGIAEIYSIVLRDRKIFVHCVCPYDKVSLENPKEYFIYQLPENGNPIPDIESLDQKLIDFNGDGSKDLVFSLYGRYESFETRRLVVLDLKTGLVNNSRDYGNLISAFIFFDFDNDGDFEISGSQGSAANNKPPYNLEYRDDTAWLMVFDKNLELINTPYGFPGPFTTLVPIPVKRGDKMEIAGLTFHDGDSGYGSFVFETSNLDSVVIKDDVGLNDPSIGKYIKILVENQDTSIMVFSTSGLAHIYDGQLNLKRTKDLGFRLGGFTELLDVNSDGKKELLLGEKFTNNLLVFNKNGRFLGKHQFGDGKHNLLSFGLINHLGRTMPYIMAGPQTYSYKIKRNYLYNLSWLVLVSLVLLFRLMAFGFQWIQRRQNREKDELAGQLNALQLQSIKNQLDPHFTFNALNVLNFLTRENDTAGIETFTNHFSKLLRRQIEMSDKPSTSLFDEIRFVEHYVEIQKLRFDVPVKYNLDASTKVKMDLKIPKMMIHTHVENAIKHGLIPARGGAIEIRINKYRNGTIIEIEDNGVGRNPNGNGSISTGKGLNILNQLYDLYYQLYKVKIEQEIIDLKDSDGVARGTLVKITI